MNGFTGHLLLMSSLCAIKLSLFKDFNIKLPFFSLNKQIFSDKNKYTNEISSGSSTSSIKKKFALSF